MIILCTRRTKEPFANNNDIHTIHSLSLFLSLCIYIYIQTPIGNKLSIGLSVDLLIGAHALCPPASITHPPAHTIPTGLACLCCHCWRHNATCCLDRCVSVTCCAHNRQCNKRFVIIYNTNFRASLNLRRTHRTI